MELNFALKVSLDAFRIGDEVHSVAIKAKLVELQEKILEKKTLRQFQSSLQHLVARAEEGCRPSVYTTC